MSQSMNNTASNQRNVNGNSNGSMNGHSFGLPGVDQEQLQSRLYSYAPKQVPENKTALKFKRITPAQKITRAKPTSTKLEPLVRFSFIITCDSTLKSLKMYCPLFSLYFNGNLK